MEKSEHNRDRNRVRKLATQYLEDRNPTGWFEELYATANWSTAAIPWADLEVNPNLASWIAKQNLTVQNKTALVIGCGLGDDAEALANWGFQVTGFDISPTAISWCQQRFPDSPVNYVVDDLLHPKILVDRQFDFVLESYTLQALPATIRPQAIGQVAQFVALAGTLLVICRGRDFNEPEGQLPWPLTGEELADFEYFGLKQVNFEDYVEQEEKSVRRFRIEYFKSD